jgi:nitric oxide reductase NorE protein
VSVETPVPVAREGRGRLPGDLDMWVMVLGDLVIFGGYFVVYMVFRALRPEAFAVAQQGVHVGAGVVNTVVLLTSSMFMALGVIAAREGRSRAAGRLVLATAGCGVVFVLVKAWEWQATIAAGHTVADEFFSFYFVFTGVHLAHVLLGLLILGVVVRELRDPRKRRQSIVEQGAVYWHLVDLLWVVIFAVLYLMR